MKNIRGAREFMIGRGGRIEDLPVNEREAVHRMYGITESDYSAIAKSVERTKKRESLRSSKPEKKKSARKKARKRRGFWEWLFS